MTDPTPLHRSAEIEDLTHLTEEDKQKINQETSKGHNSLHRSEEIEDLAHLSPQDINKPLINNQHMNTKK